MRLAASLLVALAACYEPDAIDCTVSCAGSGECTDGQVCGSDHLCSAPDVAGHCITEQPAPVTLRITIEGDGKVSVDGVGACDSHATPSCTFSVVANQRRELKAVEGGDREFVGWSQACASATDSSCELTPVMSLTSVGATFK